MNARATRASRPARATPSSRRRLPGGRPLPRGVRWAAAIVGCALLLPVLQVGAARFFDPPATPLRLLRRAEAAAHGRWLRIEREPLTLARFSPRVKRAVLAAEDDRFYRHRGFDLDNIRRAIRDHEEKGGELRGASTLTQQCARTLFLWPHRSWVRKGIEAYYTFWMELFLPKDRIFELYLNHVEWGDGVFGANAASKRAFGREATKLSDGEAALLAAVLPAPRAWSAEHPSPRVHRRQRMILKRMERLGPTPWGEIGRGPEAGGAERVRPETSPRSR